jgi:peptidoglycan/xylan/chitin deacetylase (PgdA/CDA1 family)
MKRTYKIILQDIIAGTFGQYSSKPGIAKILAYHGSPYNTRDPFMHLSPDLFEKHVKYLSENRYRSVRVSDIALDWPRILLEEKVVALTFDDGLETFRTVICPILNRYEMTATFFVPTAYIGESRQYPKHPSLMTYGDCLLSWQDLREMRNEGFEIGAHSHSHNKISKQDRQSAVSEIQLSKAILEDKLLCSIKSFAYPFGRADAFSPWTRQLLSDAGYIAGCTMIGKKLSAMDNPLELPRTGINGMDDLRRFIMKLEGYYDCINWVWKR